MPKLANARLIQAAVRARNMARAPYSRFAVGAALIAGTGKVFTGANIESASFGLTCCAERVALFKALTEGARDFAGMAIVARQDGGALPCGACRQLLAEYAPNAKILIADCREPAAIREFTVAELLPGAFLAFNGEAKAETETRVRPASRSSTKK